MKKTLLALSLLVPALPRLALAQPCSDSSAAPIAGFDSIACAGARAEVDEYRVWARAFEKAGLIPEQVVVLRGKSGGPVFYNVKGAIRNRLGAAIYLPDGRIPPGLEAFLLDHGIPVDTLAGEMTRLGAPDLSQQAVFDRAHAIGDRVLRNAGIDPRAPGNETMRYSMARYFQNGTTDQALAYLAEHWNGNNEDLIASKLIGPRWSSKIKRNLDAPFTNEQSVRSIEALSRHVNKVVTAIRAKNVNGAPLEMHLAGSILKGRMGATSDTDLQILTPDAALLAFALEGEFGVPSGNGTAVDTGDLREFLGRGKYFGPTARIGDGAAAEADPDWLAKFYLSQTAEWGVEIERKADGSVTWTLDPVKGVAAFRRESPRVSEEVFGAARTLKGALPLSSIAHYLEDLGSVEEANVIPAPRVISMGERLLQAKERCGLQPRDAMERMLIDFATAARKRAATAPGS